MWAPIPLQGNLPQDGTRPGTSAVNHVASGSSFNRFHIVIVPSKIPWEASQQSFWTVDLHFLFVETLVVFGPLLNYLNWTGFWIIHINNYKYKYVYIYIYYLLIYLFKCYIVTSCRHQDYLKLLATLRRSQPARLFLRVWLLVGLFQQENPLLLLPCTAACRTKPAAPWQLHQPAWEYTSLILYLLISIYIYMYIYICTYIYWNLVGFFARDVPQLFGWFC